MHMNSSILYCELVAVWLSDVIIRSLLARLTGYCEKAGWLPYCPASMPLPQSQTAGKPVPGRCVSATKTPYCLRCRRENLLLASGANGSHRGCKP
jgi:hypothetical protein